MINIILIVVIIILTYLNLYNIFIIKYKKEHIKLEKIGLYLNKEELYEYLKKDEDNYIKNFSNKDLTVRNVNNINEYYDNIKKACIDINEDSIRILNECIHKANNKLNKYKCIGFDGSKCANIQWKIGLINNNLYEEGFPHTRNNLIIIPKSSLNNKESLINTLIHEKIHVYQKTYPQDIIEYLNTNGFTKYKLRSSFNNIINTRSNPDMDEWIYKNKDNQIMIAEYNDNPKSIMDINIKPNNNSKYEHPFEYMAYDITNKI
jgi:hypothetical protein